MAKFPDETSVKISTPLSDQISFQTMRVEFESGSEQRRQKWTYPRRNPRVVYDKKKLEDIKTLWEFYIARGGAYEAFNFFYPYSSSYEDEYVGTGDGSTTSFNLPCRNGSSFTVKLDGVTQSSGYSISSGGGADGADLLTFTSAPGSGEIITIDFTGNLKIRAVFADDNMDFDVFYRFLATTGLQLRGLLNE